MVRRADLDGSDDDDLKAIAEPRSVRGIALDLTNGGVLTLETWAGTIPFPRRSTPSESQIAERRQAQRVVVTSDVRGALSRIVLRTFATLAGGSFHALLAAFNHAVDSRKAQSWPTC